MSASAARPRSARRCGPADPRRPRARPAQRPRRASRRLVRGGEIAEIGAAGPLAAGPTAPRSSTAPAATCCPAFVDPHVHLRTPGQEHKEDLETGTRAAAAGGFCAVLAMPNTDPVIDTRAVAALAARRRRARRAHPGRLPAGDHARARRRGADRDGRAARRGRARLHRRRPPVAVAGHAAQGAAVPAAQRRRPRAARGGPVAARAAARCTRARSARRSASPGSRASASRR